MAGQNNIFVSCNPTDPWILDQAIDAARTQEASISHMVSLDREAAAGATNVNAIRYENRHRYHREIDENDECGHCGTKHPPCRCPAWKKTCDQCGKRNHFASGCRSRPLPSQQAQEVIYDRYQDDRNDRREEKP